MKRAFTLIECLVVVAIIGVLVALLLPAVHAAMNAAKKSNDQGLPERLEAVSNSFYIDTGGGSQARVVIIRDKQTEQEFILALHRGTALVPIRQDR